MEESILTGGLEDLNKIKADLEKREALKQDLENAIIRCGQLEGDISSLEKQTADTIEETLKKRINEVSSSFDKEISEENGRMRATKNKRFKAKNKGVKQRIQDETSDLKRINSELNNEIKTTFKAKRVPMLCNSKVFYTLFCTKSLVDWLILILTAIICLVGIPVLAYNLLKWHIFFKILIIVVIVIVFILLYVTIWLTTMDLHRDIIVDMGVKRDTIAQNKKKIKMIKKDIKKDKDESKYNLDNFDEEIAEINERIDSATEKKRKALEDFEKNTKPAIVSEITDRNKSKLEEMKKEVQEISAKRKSLEAEEKELAYHITEAYEGFIGSEYMDVRRIEDLIAVINSGNATNISEAINYIKANP